MCNIMLSITVSRLDCAKKVSTSHLGLFVQRCSLEDGRAYPWCSVRCNVWDNVKTIVKSDKAEDERAEDDFARSATTTAHGVFQRVLFV